MRWELLFADLEAFADATERAAFESDVADRGRAERAALALTDRLRGHLGAELTFRLLGADTVRGRLADVGPDWVLLDDGGQVVLPIAAVVGVDGVSRLAATPPDELSRRAGLGVVLRRLSRDRVPVRVFLLDGTALTGTIDRVGADHLDLARHAADELRRVGAVRGVVVIRLGALAQIRAAG
ncbi:MAG TPA: hypothetical protein VI248_06965 [Kineosporiaceae bacterium]